MTTDFSLLIFSIIIINYHKININIKFKALDECCFIENANRDLISIKSSLYIDYIFLDTEERRQFAQTSHEYLIEQLQYSTEIIDTNSKQVKINFSHPIKELVWIVQKNEVLNHKQWFNFSDALDNSHGSGITDDPLGDGLTNPNLSNLTSNFVFGSTLNNYNEDYINSAIDSDTFFLGTTASTTNDIYNNMIFEITKGLGSSFKTIIGDYTGVTKTIDLYNQISVADGIIGFYLEIYLLVIIK